MQQGGERRARTTVVSFLRERGHGYSGAMSSPVSGEQGCSRLSPYLAWGCISMREVHQRTERRLAQARRARGGTWARDLTAFRSRLRWNGHFVQRLESEPASEFQNLNRGYDGMREADFDADHFAAWCAGRTGYPMVDAVMRSLHATGWTTFRMRAMLISFAAHDLWLHWRSPAVFLARHFLDFEPGIHFSQVQMQSGTTGINRLRIYDPTKQAREHDPDGRFIRRWVPELQAVPDDWIHAPWTLPPLLQHSLGVVIGRDYPAPIVDHLEAVRRARRIEEAWGAKPRVRDEAQRVFAEHGSRLPAEARPWERRRQARR